MFAGFSPAAGDGFRLRLHSRIKVGGALPGERSSAPCTPWLVRQWLRIEPRVLESGARCWRGGRQVILWDPKSFRVILNLPRLGLICPPSFGQGRSEDQGCQFGPAASRCSSAGEHRGRGGSVGQKIQQKFLPSQEGSFNAVAPGGRTSRRRGQVPAGAALAGG